MKQRAVRVAPPSLSLPHKGGGNAVAPLCPTAGSIRVHARRCVHALAPARGRQRRGLCQRERRRKAIPALRRLLLSPAYCSEAVRRLNVTVDTNTTAVPA